MPDSAHELCSMTSLTMLAPLLSHLDPDDRGRLAAAGALPMPCVALDWIATTVAATPVNAIPMYRSEMAAMAALDRRDVALVRHGLHPEVLDDVSIDTVLGRVPSVPMHWDMVLFRGIDRSLWLVPPRFDAGPSIRLLPSGLLTAIRPPYRTVDDYSDGVGRAARETVLNLRRMRRA